VLTVDDFRSIRIAHRDGLSIRQIGAPASTGSFKRLNDSPSVARQ
jgi:hypothetical protein